jgi:hypothetical protein
LLKRNQYTNTKNRKQTNGQKNRNQKDLENTKKEVNNRPETKKSAGNGKKGNRQQTQNETQS